MRSVIEASRSEVSRGLLTIIKCVGRPYGEHDRLWTAALFVGVVVHERADFRMCESILRTVLAKPPRVLGEIDRSFPPWKQRAYPRNRVAIRETAGFLNDSHGLREVRKRATEPSPKITQIFHLSGEVSVQ
jgi:hypothetical protein